MREKWSFLQATLAKKIQAKVQKNYFPPHDRASKLQDEICPKSGAEYLYEYHGLVSIPAGTELNLQGRKSKKMESILELSNQGVLA